MNDLLVIFIILFAVFTQSLAGFGVALVSMPFLTESLGIGVAAPLVALISLTAKTIILFRYRANFSLRAVVRLIVAALVGIPVGMAIAEYMNGDIVVMLLGIVIAGYALYALINPHLPRLENTLWAYGLGFLSGILAGAYNVGGPPIVAYGTSRQWPPHEFKSNLQGYAMLNSVMVIGGHALGRNYTPEVWRYFILSIPVLLIGVWLGFVLDGRLNRERFRLVVLVLLLVMGIKLIL